MIEYSAHKNEIENGQTYLINNYVKIPVQVFGKHNMKNISGAKAVCIKLGISEEMFYEAIQTFKGAANRLELLERTNGMVIYRDFAHAPSKLKATTNAVKKQFPSRHLVAILELHTFSSLSKDFLNEYRDTFKSADEPIVFFDPHTVEHKKLAEISPDDIKKSFRHPKLEVYTDKEKLKEFLLSKEWKNKNLLLMSSGNFGGLNIKELAKTIVSK
jgi:UDP-N-acetylmuramate: L-alanyl-gamma-D-glutamyl-meso-diaminopimelate ligase